MRKNKNLVKQVVTKAGIGVLCAVVALQACYTISFSSFSVSAATEISYDLCDPVSVTGSGTSGTTTVINVTDKNEIATAISGKTVVYTGYFYYMDSVERSNVAEYAVTVNGSGEHVITAKYSGGGNEIPVPGYLVSIPSSVSGYDSYAVGDAIVLSEEVSYPSYSIDNVTTRLRAPIDYLNSSLRSNDGIVYYGPDFGDDTGQNMYGTEMSVELDEDDGGFYVKEFRSYGVSYSSGDTVGITIPDRGFALSAYQSTFQTENYYPYVAFLREGQLFSAGDEVELSGYDYLGLDSEVSTSFDYLDPTDDDNPTGAGYAENRGTNQLNIYTKSVDSGGSELGTNTWGYEAAVNSDGVVTAVSVNVISIPTGGFVISGHGTAGDWIASYIRVGASASYDTETKTLTITTSRSSFLTTMQNNYSSYSELAATYKTRLYDLDFDSLDAAVVAYGEIVDEATSLSAAIDAETDEKKSFLYQVDYKTCITEADTVESEILMYMTGSSVVEGRAVWHRPNVSNLETNLEGIQQCLSILADCGINSVFVETLWNGYASFKSSTITYHPTLAQYTYGSYDDYLTAYIAEAEKVGIEVHAWVENFFVGGSSDTETAPEDQSVFDDSILDLHPEWALYTREGSVFQPYEVSGGSYYTYIDPANPEARQFLLDFYEEIITTFPNIAGLNLDYIRYPTSYGGAGYDDIDSGYTRVAMETFLEEYGYGIAETDDDDLFRTRFIALIDSDETIEQEWHDYRVEVISSFVKEVRDMVDETNPNVLISTATVPDYEEAIETKMQDWRTWVRNGWIDLCTPMSYYLSEESVESNASQMVLIINNIAYSYVGLGPYQGFSLQDYILQIQASRNAGSTGYNMFEASSILLNEDVQYILKATANRSSAVLPTSDAGTVLSAVFDDILDKSDRLYIENNAMTTEQREALSAKFDEILAMDAGTAEELVALYSEIEALQSEISTYASGWARIRISELLDTALTNVDIKISRAYISEGTWDPSAGETRPDKLSSIDDSGSQNEGNPSGGTTDVVDETEDGGTNVGLIVGLSVGGGVVVVAAVVIIIVCRKKKS